jgi:hypothetical protein
MTPSRIELVTLIEALLHEQCGEGPSSALLALDALGFTAGLIFQQAPEVWCKQTGRDYFMAALNAALDGDTLVKKEHLH